LLANAGGYARSLLGCYEVLLLTAERARSTTVRRVVDRMV